MVIVQDREGDIYEQFAVVPNLKTDLLIRARTNRTLTDKTKLFSCLSDQVEMGTYQIEVEARGKIPKRTANIEIKYREIEISKTSTTSKGVSPTKKLHLIEAKEVGYSGSQAICWRLLTTIAVTDLSIARMS